MLPGVTDVAGDGSEAACNGEGLWGGLEQKINDALFIPKFVHSSY